MKRRFTAPPSDDRCKADITLRDGSMAQCMRAHTDGQLCAQHRKMCDAFECEYCGGNDELPTKHCADCERPEGTP